MEECYGDNTSLISWNSLSFILTYLIFVVNGLSIFQYADDTILFLDHDIEQAKNLKLLLSVFQQMSGLKITDIWS